MSTAFPGPGIPSGVTFLGEGQRQDHDTLAPLCRINPHLTAAREGPNRLYKRWLSINRIFRERIGAAHIDLFSGGTFAAVVGDLLPPEELARALLQNVEAARRYPSSFGLRGLQSQLAKLLFELHSVSVDSDEEVVVCPGVNQALDAISRTLTGRYVFVPQYTVAFARAIPVANGAELVPIPLDVGMRIDFNALQERVLSVPAEERRYLYLNYPNNPTGSNLSFEELTAITTFTSKIGMPVVNDHDVFVSSYRPERPIISLLEPLGPRENRLELYTFSKELGLSGLRVALAAGGRSMIRMLQAHNYEMSVMTPRFAQDVALRALELVQPTEIRERLMQAMVRMVRGFRILGWANLAMPEAGIAFPLPVPKSFRDPGDSVAVDSSELFAFYLQSRVGVGTAPGSIFGDSGEWFVRIEAMQPDAVLNRVFHRMEQFGVSPDMSVPPGLAQEFLDFVANMNAPSL